MSIKSLLELAGVAHLPKAKILIESHILIEGFKEAQVEFGSVAGEEQAQQTIAQFRDLVNRNQVQGNERNIDYWRKQGWDAFSKLVSTKSQEKSKTQEKRSKVEGKSITIHEDRDWLVVVPIDKDASCFHGKNTDWCTTKPYAPYFEQYFYKNGITLIYFLQLDTGNKWAVACHSKTDKIEMFDKQDKSIDEATFEQQTGFDPIEYRNKVLGSQEVQTKSAESRQAYKQAIARIKKKQPFSEVDPQLEKDLLFVKDYKLLIDYCRRVKGRWPVVEKLVLRSITSAVNYARLVIKGAWYELEATFTPGSDIQHGFGGLRFLIETYVFKVKKRRWPEFETYALQTTDSQVLQLAVAYTQRMIKSPWPALESHIRKVDINSLITYTLDVSHQRDPDVEQALLLTPSSKQATDYAKHIIGGRWPELEDAMLSMENSLSKIVSLVKYATDVIGARWPEAEPIIKQERLWWRQYVGETGG